MVVAITLVSVNIMKFAPVARGTHLYVMVYEIITMRKRRSCDGAVVDDKDVGIGTEGEWCHDTRHALNRQ